ncbi:unnamed protein product [Strongylus vulgaris]|uniref:EF-hand domain-containing protein n=1 Tax=Strongylus vulgaris TaxID=40348 RepID=A0A3P7HXY4_STRVU|nr:unnamed protein product [Strongylus vulgaris]
MFKAIDFDKDYHLTPQEYLALLNELKIQKEEGDSGAPRIIEPRDNAIPLDKKKRHQGKTGAPVASSDAKASPEFTLGFRAKSAKPCTHLVAETTKLA